MYFNVHRFPLAQSCGLIKDMLAMSTSSEQPRDEGSSTEHPVPIADVAFDDFETVLRDAYNKCVCLQKTTLFITIPDTRIQTAGNRFQARCREHGPARSHRTQIAGKKTPNACRY